MSSECWRGAWHKEMTGGRCRAPWLRAVIAVAITVVRRAFCAVQRQRFTWLKAFHIIAVIAWMAGMLYLPRLFVYHCEAEPGSRQSETFKVMERRLLNAIINPAMVVTWVLGLWLAWTGGWLRRGLAAGQARPGARRCPACMAFSSAGCAISPPTATGIRQKFYRIVNEVPTILMIGIVILWSSSRSERHEHRANASADVACPHSRPLAHGTVFSYLRFISPNAGRCMSSAGPS